MQKSEQIGALAAALSKAQSAIEGALKTETNSFFKNKYADLSSVVEAIKRPLGAFELSYTQIMHDAENAVKVETVIMHSSGEWISCGELSVPVSKADAQGYGSALTYARRYSLSAAFGVAPEDDDGNAATKAKVLQHKPTQGAMESQPVEVQDRIKGLANTIVDYHENGQPDEAFVVYHELKTNEEKTALWEALSGFPKIRRAIKEIGEQKRSA